LILYAPYCAATVNPSLHSLPSRITRTTLMPMQPSPQPYPQPKTLDELLANAEHYADFCMRNSGRVTPALFLIGPDGQGRQFHRPQSIFSDALPRYGS